MDIFIRLIALCYVPSLLIVMSRTLKQWENETSTPNDDPGFFGKLRNRINGID